jgi:hypothetical protein
MDVIDPNTANFLSPAASVDQCVMSYFLLVIWGLEPPYLHRLLGLL